MKKKPAEDTSLPNRVGMITYLCKNELHQYQLAEKLGITETYLSKMLRGRVKPNKDLVVKFNTIVNRA
jgi:transcriptional regulator with XRE-family HTH domain